MRRDGRRGQADSDRVEGRREAANSQSQQARRPALKSVPVYWGAAYNIEAQSIVGTWPTQLPGCVAVRLCG